MAGMQKWMSRSALAVVGVLLASLLAKGIDAQADHQQALVNSFNYVIGTQTFSPAYQFTKAEPLLETARLIRDAGATVIKFGLDPQYAGDKVNGTPGNVREYLPSIGSLTQLARDEPSYRKVLEMRFSFFVLSAHTFSNGVHWPEDFGPSRQRAEYQELYDLTSYLLTTYAGTNKTFYLGDQEGDRWLRHSASETDDARVTPAKVQAMVDWLNVRQRAIDDAKRDTPHQGVQVWHYSEVNYVKLAMAGRQAVVNAVLPHTQVDFVSYACYDTGGDPPLLKKALAFIESNLPAKPALAGKRVFIGEYGFPAIRNSPEEQDLKSRHLMQAGIEWGCPFILYWQLYNREMNAKGEVGYWMINDKNEKQPIYHTYENYYSQARRYVSDYIEQNGRPPTMEEYQAAAVMLLDQ